MRFILATGTLEKLGTLRVQYEKERKVNLNVKPSKIGMPIILGAIDVETRQAQISFIEKMYEILKPNLLKEGSIHNEEQWHSNLTVSRKLIAACLYVDSQISRPKKNSALHRIIQDCLGINVQNYLDEEDKQICYFTAHRLMNSFKMNLEEANYILKRAKLSPLSELEWQSFSKFLDTQINEVKTKNNYTNYPFTSVTQPLFGAAFSYTGASLGYLGGDMLSNSTNVMSTRYKLTTFVGSTLLILGPASPTSVALFAPVIAGKIITSFCSISLAHVLGITMGLLGQGIGMGIGLPLDLSYRMIWKACSIISDYYIKDNNIPKITGLRLADGMSVISGLIFEMTPEDQLPEHYNSVEVDKNGNVYVNNQPLDGTASKELLEISESSTESVDYSESEESLETFNFLNEQPSTQSIPHDDVALAQQCG